MTKLNPTHLSILLIVLLVDLGTLLTDLPTVAGNLGGTNVVVGEEEDTDLTKNLLLRKGMKSSNLPIWN